MAPVPRNSIRSRHSKHVCRAQEFGSVNVSHGVLVPIRVIVCSEFRSACKRQGRRSRNAESCRVNVKCCAKNYQDLWSCKSGRSKFLCRSGRPSGSKARKKAASAWKVLHDANFVRVLATSFRFSFTLRDTNS